MRLLQKGMSVVYQSVFVFTEPHFQQRKVSKKILFVSAILQFANRLPVGHRRIVTESNICYINIKLIP